MEFSKLFLTLFLLFSITVVYGQQQQEVFLGQIPNLAHGVSGDVYAIGDRTIVVRNLNYDGQAPDAYFWVGTGDKPTATGTPLADENGLRTPIKGYRNATVTLQLPKGKTFRDYKYFGIWCRAFGVNFGHVNFNFV